ncbi:MULTISPECIES: TRM11 family SAM-dependent methyltransferase [Achromobacter]|uniref:TRM11 family SAM-dependent methyltransferase n=1 Tax=Achromobacter TaxID=222 RepID=UPI002FE15CCD
MYTTTSGRTEREVRRARILGLSHNLQAGVHPIAANQLFVSGAALADQVVTLADIRPGARVFDPSAGTGDLLAAATRIRPGVQLLAVEIDARLAAGLRARMPEASVTVADFLEVDPAALGLVDRIVMNPPFRNGADIKHIEHARRFLAPGGRLVAICANGPRQQESLRPGVLAAGGSWEPLPSDAFKHAGTAVRAVMLSFSV